MEEYHVLRQLGTVRPLAEPVTRGVSDITKRLIICGKNRLFRKGLKRILENPHMTVLGEVSFVEGAFSLLRSSEYPVDLMVCDATENTHEDLKVLQGIGQEFPEIGIMILTDNLNRAGFDMAIAGGARAFLPKTISPAALQTTLKLILLEENIFAAPASLSARIHAKSQTAKVASATELRTRLSATEDQILSCLEAGQPNKLIARNLDLPEAAVKLHLKALLRKINADNRTQAAVWSMSHKIAGSEFQSRG